MRLFYTNNEDYEKIRDEIMESLNNCNVCNEKITPRENAEFNCKCEDCFYDSRK